MIDFRSALQNSFVRNVSVLAGGTAFAQALNILVLPLLTRIYSPEEFGLLGVFSALLAITSVVSSLRYDIAIPIPKSDKAAANLLAVALVCLTAFTLILLIVILLFSQRIASLMNTVLLAEYLWLLPIAVAAAGAYGTFQYWATRKKAFSSIARTRVEQSIGGVVTQLLLGWIGAGTLGLIAGQIVNSGAGFWGLARRLLKDDRAALQGVKIAQMKAVASEYDRFPKYSTFEAFTNTSGIQLPLILIATLATGVEVGFLMLAMRIMQAPMGLIGSSISQVYFSRAVDEHRNGNLGVFTARTIGGLAKTGVGPIIFAGIIAPSLFGLVFGEKWQRAGELVAWMTPWFVLQFLASPVSMSLQVTGNQRKALLLTVFGLFLRISMLYVGAKLTVGCASESYAVSGFIFYSICLYVFCGIAKVSYLNLCRELKAALPIIISFVLLGICFKALIS